MESFASFSPSPGVIKVNAAIFSKQPNKAIGKGKGHLVRCIQKKDDLTLSAIEINNVDSVDKVFRIVTEHMRLNVNPKACECMKYYFQGNESLEEGDPSKAIALYNQALSLADKRTRQTSQLPKGSILMKRARAYLQRAANHRKILRLLVKDLTDTVPSASTMKILYQTASSHPELSASIFQRLAGDAKVNQGKFRQIRYRHDMYEFALLHATQDSLQATKLLPKSANAWYIAGECLAELRKLNESNQYYVRALALDPSMKDVLTGLMEKNKLSQEFMDVARASGFSGDTLRLALDVGLAS
jgi:tetratricopeptide (TPR) repeat protein